METVVFTTLLREGAEQAYEAAHATIPGDLDAALRDAGVQEWAIWRDGRRLIHRVVVEDYRRMRVALRDHPANLPWQEYMRTFLEVEDDFSESSSGLPLVWRLP